MPSERGLLSVVQAENEGYQKPVGEAARSQLGVAGSGDGELALIVRYLRGQRSQRMVSRIGACLIMYGFTAWLQQLGTPKTIRMEGLAEAFRGRGSWCPIPAPRPRGFFHRGCTDRWLECVLRLEASCGSKLESHPCAEGSETKSRLWSTRQLTITGEISRARELVAQPDVITKPR